MSEQEAVDRKKNTLIGVLIAAGVVAVVALIIVAATRGTK